MTTGSETNPDPILEEHSRRVFTLFESKSKSFRRLFHSLVALALIFLVFLFIPYVSLQGEGERIVLRQDTLRDEINLLKTNIDMLDQSRDGFATFMEKTQIIREKMTDFDLHQKLKEESVAHELLLDALKQELQNEPEAQLWKVGKQPEFSDRFFHVHPDLLAGKKDSCFWLVGEKWLKCEIGKQVHAHHMNLQIAVRKLEQEVTPFVKLDSVKPRLHDLDTAFRMWLSGNSLAWRQDSQNPPAELRLELSLYWHDYYTVMADFAKSTEKLSAELKERETDNRQELERLQARKAEVEQRLQELHRFNQIQTPVGQLPVGLNDVVMFFPVILAVLFLLCVSLFGDTVRLRRTFHELCQKRDTGQNILTDKQVALIAPLWLDPLDAGQNRMARYLVFALPFLVFMVAVILLLQNRLFADDVSLFSGVAYLILYAVSLAAFGSGFRQVITTLRNYKNGDGAS